MRIVTDQGISGYGQAESVKPYLKPMVLFYKKYLVGQDPTNVAAIMMKIRRMGAFKPWGAAVSAIEIALWDVAGKAAGLPVYKLLGERSATASVPTETPKTTWRHDMMPRTPQDYAEIAQDEGGQRGLYAGEGAHRLPQYPHDDGHPQHLVRPQWHAPAAPYMHRGLLTERGIDNFMACVEAAKKVLGNDIGLALDCGPGWTVKDAIRFARAVEPLNLAWLEDLHHRRLRALPKAQVFKQVTDSTSTPIHTGEEIYLRENFKELIEMQAVNVIGPDPEDVGGIAEMKWIAEYADLHGILVAPHGIFDGLFGVAAQVHMGAAMPQNYIAFEYAKGQPEWWYDIVEGLPDPIVKNGFIDVWDKPGLGLTFREQQPKRTSQMRIATSSTKPDTGFRLVSQAADTQQALSFVSGHDFSRATPRGVKIVGAFSPFAPVGMTIHLGKLYLAFPNKIVIPTGA